MSLFAEQTRYERGSSKRKKFEKRLASVRERRAGKSDPENAPTKRRYHGWAD